MMIDELPEADRNKTPYCYSCGAIRREDELGRCLRCQAPLCFLDGCKGQCLCSEVSRKR